MKAVAETGLESKGNRKPPEGSVHGSAWFDLHFRKIILASVERMIWKKARANSGRPIGKVYWAESS